MPTFKRADNSVRDMAMELIDQFHETLKDNSVKIDFVFAYPDFDETTGEPINNALQKNGVRALGIARKLPAKDRAMGRADAEISLDGHWWQNAEEGERKALLDHELHHLVATADRDDMGRPIIKMRKHDYEIGMFHVIAQRHGRASQEVKYAAVMLENSGQYLWPELAGIKTGKGSRTAKLELQNA